MHKTAWFLMTMFALVGLTSCGDDDETPTGTTTNTSNSYQGPGSDWDATLDSSDNTFELVESSANWNITGTYEDLTTGFKKLTVGSSTGTGAPTQGSVAYGLDIPGVVFLLKPLEANSEIISMVRAGECPTSTRNLNWVIAKMDSGADASSSSQDVFGTFTTDGTTASLPTKYALDDSSIGANSLGSFSCSGGEVTVADAKLYLTQTSGAIVRTGLSSTSEDDDGIIVAMPSESITSGQLSGNFVGLVFSQNETYPTSVSISGNTVEIESINVETGVADAQIDNTLTFNAFDTPESGFIGGTLTGGQEVQCIANTDLANSGKSILFCSGSDPADTTKLFALLVISR